MIVGWVCAGNRWAEGLAVALVGLVLADMPLSLGKLPFASRVLVMVCASTGVAERTTMARAVRIRMRLPLWMPSTALLRAVIASSRSQARDFCRGNFARPKREAGAFSSGAGTGSRAENVSKQKPGARF